MTLLDHLDKLNAFKVIVESGTMIKAAKRLNMTQPSLSRLIQTLESASGKTLLTRGRQGVAPTRAGRHLMQFAGATLSELARLEARLSSPELETAGLVRIGSYETLAEYLWPEFIARFRRSHPEIQIALKTASSREHFRSLEDGELDILVDAEPRITGDFISWLLYEDRFGFYGHPKKVPQNLAPESSDKAPIIYCPQAFDRENKLIRQTLTERGYSFRESIELDSFTAVRTFARAGLGIGVLPLRLAEHGGAKSDLEPIELKGFSARGFGAHGIYATVRSNRADEPLVRLLVKALREDFRSR